MGHDITDHKTHLSVPIFQDHNVADDEPVYIGNGQGCGTFWFKTVDDARRFIEKFRKRIRLTRLDIVGGLIPKRLCLGCKGHYSYGSKKWKQAKDSNCREYKEQLKAKANLKL